jgi:hypothetical protein
MEWNIPMTPAKRELKKPDFSAFLAEPIVERLLSPSPAALCASSGAPAASRGAPAPAATPTFLIILYLQKVHLSIWTSVLS